MNAIQDDDLLQVGMVVKEFEGSDDLAYVHVGSPEQRELFPWITRSKPVGIQGIQGEPA